MDRFSRIVLGYHGCDPAFAEALIRGEISIDQWNPSQNEYDWLGHGIYFWEFAPERAQEWSAKGGLIGAVIQLGTCLDLTNVRFTNLLADEFKTIQARYRKRKIALPANRRKLRDLDCLVINSLVKSERDTGMAFQTVRGPFLEGEPVFPGSGILRESHIQIAVIDKTCILGLFRPQLKSKGKLHGRR